MRFEAETKQLLDLMIHSLYTNKEIFLRELLSNASDALDKLRFGAITEPGLLPEGEELEIRLEPDSDARTLSVCDNGIGMTREEVIENIGSIARSGTQDMLEQLRKMENKSAPELIGRFGVGFYSAFMVADKVVLETRKAGTDASTRWSSEADGSYTLEPGSRAKQGTAVTLHLKAVDEEAGLEDFTNDWTLQRVVRRYSNYIAYPIRQSVRREERSKEAKGIVKPGGETTIVVEDKTLNSMKPLWTRPEAEVQAEEYNEFYKHIAGDWQDPLLHLRCKAEGISEYESVLFVPAEPPPDLYVWGMEYGLQLYARRVMIMERCDAAMPRFLRFIRGVVDSSDLPLNISRQTLQENRHVVRIRKFLTRKTLDMLAELQENDAEKYLGFWKKFGRALKEGVSSEYDYKDKLLPMFLFESSADPDKLTTLKEYVERMKEGQESIYYVTGESRAVVERSPHLEWLSKRGYEVLFLTDPVDEFLVGEVQEYEGHKLRSAAKGAVDPKDADADEASAEERREQEKRYDSLFGVLRMHLADSVKRVQLSNRLTASPACLTVDEHDLSPQMERLLRMSGREGPKQKRILEINGSHEIAQKLHERFEADKTDPALKEYAELLYGYAMLTEGSEMEDPGSFTKALEGVMVRGMRGRAGQA